MNAIEALEHAITRAAPRAQTRLRRPGAPDGMWWLDAKLDDQFVTVQWSLSRGFGVTASGLEDGYGEGPDETYEDASIAASRVIALLLERTLTAPPVAVGLRELRAILGYTQQEVADRLDIGQAAVSRLEHREDVTMRSLQRYVAALGGAIEIHVKTAAGDTVPLAFGAPTRPRSRSVGMRHAAAFRHRAPTHHEVPVPQAGLSFVVLRTSDLERSRSFYHSLGLDFSAERHGRGPLHYAARLSGGAVLELYPCSSKHLAGGARVGLRVADPEASIARLIADGLPMDGVRRREGESTLIVDDPDGNTVELTPV